MPFEATTTVTLAQLIIEGNRISLNDMLAADSVAQFSVLNHPYHQEALIRLSRTPFKFSHLQKKTNNGFITFM